MKTVGDIRKQSQVCKNFKKCINYQNLGYLNLKIMCAEPCHGLIVHQVSTQSNENCRSYLDTRIQSHLFFFFFFFLIWVLRPFQEYFTYIKPIVHQRWAKTEEPREKPSDHPKQNLVFPPDRSKAQTTVVRNLTD